MYKHILVGIDFSSQSQQLYFFGSQLANHFGSSLELVHIFRPEQQKGSLRSGKNVKQLQEYFQKKLQGFSEHTASGFPELNLLQTIATPGIAAEELVNYSKQPAVDLLILGVPGPSVRKPEKEFGRVAREVSQESHCPVLLLPIGANFQRVEKILFLSDYSEFPQNMMEQLSGMAYFFSAEIHLIPMFINSVRDASLSETNFSSAFAEQAPHLSTFLYTLKSNGELEEINQYLLDQQINFITIITSNRYFWQSFLNRKMQNAYRFSRAVPILINYLEG